MQHTGATLTFNTISIIVEAITTSVPDTRSLARKITSPSWAMSLVARNTWMCLIHFCLLNKVRLCIARIVSRPSAYLRV